MTWDFMTQGPKVKLAFGPAEFGLAEFSTCPTSHQQWTTSKFRLFITLINEFLIKNFQVAQNEHEFLYIITTN
jgi:hypothetical protein